MPKCSKRTYDTQLAALRELEAENERLRGIIGGLYMARGDAHTLTTAVRSAFGALNDPTNQAGPPQED